MGGVLSSFGFNQPFFFTLIGIILMLILTMALVSDPDPSECCGPDCRRGDECGGYCCGADDMSAMALRNIKSQYRLVRKNPTANDDSNETSTLIGGSGSEAALSAKLRIL